MNRGREGQIMGRRGGGKVYVKRSGDRWKGGTDSREGRGGGVL